VSPPCRSSQTSITSSEMQFARRSQTDSRIVVYDVHSGDDSPSGKACGQLQSARYSSPAWYSNPDMADNKGVSSTNPAQAFSRHCSPGSSRSSHEIENFTPFESTLQPRFTSVRGCRGKRLGRRSCDKQTSSRQDFDALSVKKAPYSMAGTSRISQSVVENGQQISLADDSGESQFEMREETWSGVMKPQVLTSILPKVDTLSSKSLHSTSISSKQSLANSGYAPRSPQDVLKPASQQWDCFEHLNQSQLEAESLLRTHEIHESSEHVRSKCESPHQQMSRLVKNGRNGLDEDRARNPILSTTCMAAMSGAAVGRTSHTCSLGVPKECQGMPTFVNCRSQ